MNIYFILFLGFLALGVLAFFKIRNSSDKVKFTWQWSFFMGAFVWEDIVIFSPLFSLASLVTYLSGQPKFLVLFLFSFWLIRSLGESRYFMLQQLVRPDFHPHNIGNQFKLLKKVFNGLDEQQCFILMQVFYQSIAVMSLIGLIFTIFY